MKGHIQRILVLDDDEGVRLAMTEILRRDNFKATATGTILETKEQLESGEYDLLMADLILGGISSLNYLGRVRQNYPELPIILMTGHGSLESAIEAIKIGIFDYLLKPINIEELRLAINRLATYQRMEEENTYLREELARSVVRSKAVWGESPEMQEVLRLVDQVAATETSILIQGESGSGKDVIARLIVEKSPRASQPLIKISCASSHEKELEMELFGVERGANTEADQRRSGKLEMAHRGTLWLDEISSLPLSIQEKLVKVIQEKQFERVGGKNSIPVDVRLLATTTRYLQQEVEMGRFREDLYYRLNVVPIYLPPLRDRGRDVEAMAHHLLAEMTHKHGKPNVGFTREALERLTSYSWPGNVRELQNAIERAVILSAPGSPVGDGDFSLQGAPRESLTLFNSGTLPTIEEMEKRLIGLMLKQTGNNKTKAAKRLGISIRTMRNKLAAYEQSGIQVDNPDNLLRD